MLTADTDNFSHSVAKDDALCFLIMYFNRYFRLTGAVADNISTNEQIPRIGVLSVQCYLRAPELLLEHLSLLPRTNMMTTSGVLICVSDYDSRITAADMRCY